jgi:hypothetical protein
MAEIEEGYIKASDAFNLCTESFEAGAAAVIASLREAVELARSQHRPISYTGMLEALDVAAREVKK